MATMINNCEKELDFTDMGLDYSAELFLELLELEKETELLLRAISKRLPPKAEFCEEYGMTPISSRSDILKMLQESEKRVYHICNEIARIERIRRKLYGDDVKKIQQETDSSVVSVINRPDMFGIKTPYLKRETSPFLISSLPYQSLLWECVENTNLNAKHLKSVPQILVYAISVYPSETEPALTLDPDNLALKYPIDILTRKLMRDDNGHATHLHIGSVFNDNLAPGTYTLILEKSSEILSAEDVAQLLLKG